MAFVIMQNYFRANPNVNKVNLNEIQMLRHLPTIDIPMGGQITMVMMDSVFDELVKSLREQDVRLSKTTWMNIMNVRRQCTPNNKYAIGLQSIMCISKTSVDELERLDPYRPNNDPERLFRSNLMEVRLQATMQALMRPMFAGFAQHVESDEIKIFLKGRWAVAAIVEVINSARPNSVNSDGVKKYIDGMKIYYADQLGYLDGFVVINGICVSDHGLPRDYYSKKRISTFMLALHELAHYIFRSVFNKYQLSTPSSRPGQIRMDPQVPGKHMEMGRMAELTLIGGIEEGFEIDWNMSSVNGANTLLAHIIRPPPPNVPVPLPLISVAECAQFGLAGRDDRDICISQYVVQ